MIERARTFLARLRGSFAGSRLDEEFDEEVEAHLALLREKFVREGTAPEEAARAARLQFGGVTQVREQQHERRRLFVVETLLRDFRCSVRTLARTPGFTSIALLTLALGIGANTAISSVINGVLLRPLPYADPGRLVWIHV